MWYVIQTQSGQEQEVWNLIKSIQDSETYGRSLVPIYEEVRRSHGKIMITFRNLFPGYIFVDTDDPQVFWKSFHTIPNFVRILGVEDEDKTKTFIPVGASDTEFLDSLFEDGVMHVSYIKMRNHSYIEKIVGPLAKYRNHITKLDVPHRRAIVETDMFGKHRRIKFGLWLDGDPYLPWLEQNKVLPQASAIDSEENGDIGIHPGDIVTDESGLFGDFKFTVESVDIKHRTIITYFDLRGQSAKLEMAVDSLRVVG